jgi:hypothetical protein
MPHARCSVCLHSDLEAIDADRGPVRVVARRFGLSPAAVDRHRHHGGHAKARINSGQIEHIDAEIKKLIRAQNRAKKKRDGAGALAIARELRNWFVLRSKAEIAAIGSASEQSGKDGEQLSPAEALALARVVIEGQIADPEVCAWILALAERLRPPDAVPGEEIASVDGSEERPENGDISGTVEIERS